MVFDEPNIEVAAQEGLVPHDSAMEGRRGRDSTHDELVEGNATCA